MKKKKLLLGYIIFFVCLLISVAATFLFGNKGISLMINLIFAGMMFVIVLLSMRRIRKYTKLVSALSKGTDFLDSLTKEEASQIKDGTIVFQKDEKLARLLTTYYKENDGYDGEISDYINEELLDDEIQKQVTELISGAMTGLGLLGTFIGFMIGIKDLNLDQNELFESIKTLMDGMKTAFLTSIFGVVYSLLFNWYYKHICSYGREELNKFYDVFYDKVASNPENRNVNLIVDYHRRQVEALETLPTAITAAIAEELSKVFTPTISRMDSLMENFVNVATTNQQESLERVVNSFVDSMNSILNEKFILLSETLDKTCQLQKANFEMMDTVVTTITAQASHLSELNASIEKSLSNIQEYESKIEKFTESIIIHNEKSHELLSHVLESQNHTYAAVSEFTENVSNTTSYINRMSDVINQQKTVIEEFCDKSKEITDYNASMLAQVNKESAEILGRSNAQTTDAVNVMQKQMEEFIKTSSDLINEIKTVGSRIHSECNGLEESLGSSLNSTFKVFDSNLAEITTHLNSSIKEMQELVDRLPVDLGTSIGKLRASMNEYVTLLSKYDESDFKGDAE